MKTHLSLPVGNIDSNVAFYKTLLASEPTKHYGDYALFITEDPGIELSLTRTNRTIASDGAQHYGIVVDTTEAVDAAIERLRAAAYEIDIEREETCCYANQTKVWATDPDGRRWEVYTVHEETEHRDDPDGTCCSGAD